MKVIVWFKTVDDVNRTLRWMDNNTDYRWNSGDKPTEFTGWSDVFFKDLDFILEYGDNMSYSFKSLNDSSYDVEEINFEALIWEADVEESIKDEYVEKGIMVTLTQDIKVYKLTHPTDTKIYIYLKVDLKNKEYNILNRHKYKDFIFKRYDNTKKVLLLISEANELANKLLND